MKEVDILLIDSHSGVVEISIDLVIRSISLLD